MLNNIRKNAEINNYFVKSAIHYIKESVKNMKTRHLEKNNTLGYLKLILCFFIYIFTYFFFIYLCSSKIRYIYVLMALNIE